MMKKTIVCCYLAVISLCAFAQRSSLKDAYTFGNSITAAELKHYLYIVAGPEMEGRETATNGQRKAAAYLEEQFKAIGLTPPTEGKYQQAYPVVGENLEKAGLEINSYTFPLTVDFIPVTSLNYNASQYFSEVVYVNKGEAADYSGTSVKGKLVLIRGIEFNSSQEKIAIAGAQRKMQEALNQGAAAVLLVQTNFPRSSTAKKLQQSLTKYKATQWPNTYFVSEKVAEKIVGDSNWTKALAGKLPIQKFKSDIALTFEKKQENLESTNVIGLIKGTENQNECIVISAHYDHIGIEDGKINYGADDDGSGTVALLEIAQAFMKASAAGKGPKKTIVFLAVSGEEKGLWGSEYYAANPVISLDKTSVNLNIDMIGRVGFDYQKSADSANYVYVIGDNRLSSELHSTLEKVNKTTTNLILDRKYNDKEDPNRFYFRSDHYNFAVKGVPVIFFFNGVHKDYHQPTDTPDKINYKALEKRAQLIFYLAWEIANKKELLKRDIPL